MNDNLDLGCTIIERAATDKAVRDIDKSLAAQYEARANARRNGVDFYKHSMMQQQQSGPFPAGLPESLMPKPGNMAQQRVYEDFGRLPRGQPLQARGYGEGGVPGSPMQVREACCSCFGVGRQGATGEWLEQRGLTLVGC